MNKPLLIAHRGYSQFEKENTLVAFTAAGNIDSYFGIETDVHVTTDNHFVIIHDENVNRVTAGTVDLNVETNTFDMVRKVRLADVDDSLNRIDLVIPEMIEYFRICKKYNKKAIFELKQVFTKEQIKEMLDIIDSIGMLENTIFISFILEDLIALRELAPTQPAQWLLCEFKEEHLKYLLQYNLDVDAHHGTMTKEKIDLIHSKGLKVNVWTVNDQNRANELAKMGVDFITSNWVKEITE